VGSSYSAETQEVIDGELAARVFQLIQITDTGSHVHVSLMFCIVDVNLGFLLTKFQLLMSSGMPREANRGWTLLSYASFRTFARFMLVIRLCTPPRYIDYNIVIYCNIHGTFICSCFKLLSLCCGIIATLCTIVGASRVARSSTGIECDCGKDCG
jgi:hypothetical protein